MIRNKQVTEHATRGTPNTAIWYTIATNAMCNGRYPKHSYLKRNNQLTQYAATGTPNTAN